MKKLLSALLAIVLIVSLGAPAYAQENSGIAKASIVSDQAEASEETIEDAVEGAGEEAVKAESAEEETKIEAAEAPDQTTSFTVVFEGGKLSSVNLEVQYFDQTDSKWKTIPNGTFPLEKPTASVAVNDFDMEQYGNEAGIVISDFAGTFSTLVSVTSLPTETVIIPVNTGLFDMRFSDETQQELDGGFVYTGKPIEPQIFVTGDLTAPANIDPQYYDVSFSNNTDVGKAIVTVTAKSPFRKGCKRSFRITAFDLSTAKTSVKIDNVYYTGSPVTPEPVVRTVLNGKAVTLVNGTDYTVTYSKNTNVGEATAVIKGQGNFKGSIKQTFKILYPVKKLTITGIENKEYTGKPIKQSVVVKYGTKTLVNGTDYKVTYENNVEVGRALMTITGKGCYTGSVKKTFKITKPFSALTVTGIKDKTYTGKPVTLNIVVKDGNKKLVENTDYTVTYENNVGPGKAIVTVRGKGFYTGKLKKSFMIRKMIYDVTIKGIKDVVYNGKPQTFDIVVKDGKTVLTEKVDYTVSYAKNINAGTGTVSIKGKGKYKGVVRRSFEIKKAPLTSVTLKYSSMTYNGKKRTQTKYIVVRSGEMVLTQKTDFNVKYDNNLKPGTATVTVTGKGNFTGTLTATFTIKKYKLKAKDVEISYTEKQYTGKELKPAVTVTAHYSGGGTEKLTNAQYKVTYKNNKNAGTAKVIVEGIGDCHTGKVTKSFKITPVAIKTATLSKSEYVYDGTEKKPSVTVTAVVDGKAVTLKSGTDYTLTYANNTKAGPATVTVAGKGNFKGTLVCKFTIKPAPITSMTLSGDTYVYTGSAICPQVKVTGNSKTLVSGTDYILSYTNNINAGTATVTVSGTGNYTGTLSKKFTIKPASLENAMVYTDMDAVMKFQANQQYPSVTSVIVNGRKLTAGTDYYVQNPTIGNYDKPLEYVAYLSIIGKGNYTGTAKKRFVAMDASYMIPQDIDGYDVRTRSYKKQTQPIYSLLYNKDSKTKYLAGRDFTVTYTGIYTAGTATARVKGTSKALLGLDKTYYFRITN